MQERNDSLHFPQRPSAPATEHLDAVAAARARLAALDSAPIPTQTSPSHPLAQTHLITNREELARSIEEPKRPRRTRPALPSKFRPIIIAVGIFLIALLVTKAPVIASHLNYATATPAPAPAAPAAVVPAESTISIPKINVHAPVVYEPSVVEANVQKSLERGVVHYGTTANPGERGNSVIFGHSSNDWWEAGDFKFVFVLLDKLAPGDKITVDYQSKRYTYEVTGSRVVEPTEISVLNPTPQPTLTLITCTPPGTAWKRLVVTAKQIDPAPATAVKAQTKTGDAQPLPGDEAESNPFSLFTHQLTKAWSDFAQLFSGEDEAEQDSGAGTLPSIK